MSNKKPVSPLKKKNVANKTALKKKRLVASPAAAPQSAPPLAWGAKVSAAFRAKVRVICAELQVDPDYLMSCMAFESAESFSPSVVNPMSKAVGLIQFMPVTAQGLGTTSAKLAAMSAVDQLDYVRQYFWPYRKKLNTLEDVYMAILWPAAIGKPNTYALFKAPSKAYVQNKGLDLDQDGAVSKFEAADFVRKKMGKGLGPGFAG